PPRRAAALRRLAWQLAPWALPTLHSANSSAGGWIAPQILPPPERVVDTLADLASSGDLVRHTLISLQRVLVGFAAGTLLGVSLGVAL
ncbi:ABC transporter permease, partial [Burkholderia cenocepacia]|nr:ABC transporter permease [Burkholderia cenocepacia]